MRKMERFLGDHGHFVLAVLFGIVTTLVSYRGYGGGNHIEQLPIVLRQLDSTFLSNDFFTNAATDSIARLYYARIIALLAGSEQNLPFLYFILTLISNIATSIITYSLARELFNGSSLAGIYAAALVMSVSTFNLGWHSMIYADVLIPTSIAGPFLLEAIRLLLRGKLQLAMILCGIASFLHPLFALEIAGVILITHFTYSLFRKSENIRDGLVTGSAALLLIMPFSLISLLPQLSQADIASDQFIYILAHFRHPHHYVPSTFGRLEYISATAFLYAVTVFYFRWRKTQEGSYSLMLAILVCTVLILCLAGYVLVELFPVRIWATAQTFRLLYVVRWIGLILIGGTISGNHLQRSMKALYLVSALHPISTGLAVLSQSLGERLVAKLKGADKFLAPSLILLVPIALLQWNPNPRIWISIFLLGVFVFLILAYSRFSRKLFYATLLAGSFIGLMFVIYLGRLPSVSQMDTVRHLTDNFTPKIESELGAEGDEVALFVKQHTPKDRIFLTPPDWGQFRLLARRAIVVDYKAFPFADFAMAEWYERLITCYGNPSKKGVAMVDELEENYRQIDDHTLHALKRRYKIDYAVLYSETSTNFEVLFQNSNYKVIRLNDE